MKVPPFTALDLFSTRFDLGEGLLGCLLAAICVLVSSAARAENLVDFQRDIAPLLVARCLECHGPETAKNDFRVDDQESLLGFIEVGDEEASSLWTDYLITTDADMQMPPASHGGPLSRAELALIGRWITEGAEWPEGATVTKGEPAPVVAAPAKSSALTARVWDFQGYLHPATVHFPVALWLVGALFVLVGIKAPQLGQSVALSCLFLGTAAAIVATMMGWSFANIQGYGDWSRVDTDSEIFWHRWSAVIVTVVGIITSLFAIAALRSSSRRLGLAWRVGLLTVGMMVGAVGHQGGELTYGKVFYQRAFDRLFGVEPQSAAVEAPKTVEAEH